ncbi:RidA family protein [Aureimonas populi]|uniref:RidA family protein n=1 Tax=Aureimonas populi TaxID=1701758 RepID=A0ABW5CPL9_9HYPH|nr:RidA family protein [Aureimonas populi]
MSRRLISTGSPFERQAGYSRAVVAGNWCFVSGTTGYDYKAMTMPDTAGDQAQAAFETIAAALAEAGFSMEDVVRVRYLVTDAGMADDVFAVSGRWLGEIRPAATLEVTGLLKPEMKVEIEATAYRP